MLFSRPIPKEEVARAGQHRAQRGRALPAAAAGAAAGARRRETGEEPSLRSPDARDAEFVKNLQIFLRLVVDADALYLRAAHGLSGDPAQAAALNGRVDELRDRITLPTEVPLTLELLLAAASSWSGC